jgi:hypothetical protein
MTSPKSVNARFRKALTIKNSLVLEGGVVRHGVLLILTAALAASARAIVAFGTGSPW